MNPQLSDDIKAWAKSKCEEMVRTCRVEATDGTILFTPDGVGE